MADTYNLQRFIRAQDSDYDDVLGELRRGAKTGHWIWYIFPQISGLGSSEMSRRFALKSICEARAYAEHPILGPRLRECTQIVLDIEGRAIRQILGHPDELKFRSCMTLFSRATGENAIFESALEKYFRGQRDPLTLNRLGE